MGCQSVYQILSENQLCNYYSYNNSPGKTQIDKLAHYDYLEEPKISGALVDYTDDVISMITLLKHLLEAVQEIYFQKLWWYYF